MNTQKRSLSADEPIEEVPKKRLCNALRGAGNALGALVCTTGAILTVGLFKNSVEDGKKLSKMVMYSPEYNTLLRNHILDVVYFPLFAYLAYRFGSAALASFSKMKKKSVGKNACSCE